MDAGPAVHFLRRAVSGGESRAGRQLPSPQQKEYQRDNLEFDLYGAYDISEEDIQRVKDSLDSVSSKNKEVSMKVMLKVRGERQMCDLKLHTLWSSIKTDGYIGIVGQLDIVK
mgnify:CR=1 FL=1